jgi:hypothetical protein
VIPPIPGGSQEKEKNKMPTRAGVSKHPNLCEGKVIFTQRPQL